MAMTPKLDSIQNRRLYNSTRPISKLNDDILSQIFMINSQLDFDHPHVPSVTVRRSSQVIEKWRDLLLGYPGIWAASLDFADPVPWIHEVLARAGTSPINLTYPPITNGAMADKTLKSSWRILRPSLLSLLKKWRSPSIDEKFHLALSLTPRARQITTAIPFGDMNPTRWNYFLRYITRPSPNIRTLSLLVEPSFTFFTQSCTLPTNIFDNQAPNLRTLNLNKCSCDFRSPLFRNLTTLSVIDLFGSQGHTVTEWLQILGQMADLITLELERCLREDAIEEGKSTTNIFPVPSRLQSVTLKDDFIPCSLIFAHLHLPPSCEMVIEYYGTQDGELYQTTIADVQRKLKTSSDVGQGQGLSVSLRAGDLGFSNFHHALEDKIISFHWSTTFDSNFNRMLPPFFSILETAYSHVTDLHLEMSNVEESHIAESLLLFNKVENLRITSNPSFRQIFDVLNKFDSSDSKDTDIRLLSGLTKLSFYSLTFVEESTFQSVLDFLYRRFDMDLPIDIIRFSSCFGARRRFSELEILGVGVEWDGVDEAESVRSEGEPHI